MFLWLPPAQPPRRAAGGGDHADYWGRGGGGRGGGRGGGGRGGGGRGSVAAATPTAPEACRENRGGVAFGFGFEAGPLAAATPVASADDGGAAGGDGNGWRSPPPQMVFKPTADGLRLVS